MADLLPFAIVIIRKGFVPLHLSPRMPYLPNEGHLLFSKLNQLVVKLIVNHHPVEIKIAATLSTMKRVVLGTVHQSLD